MLKQIIYFKEALVMKRVLALVLCLLLSLGMIALVACDEGNEGTNSGNNNNQGSHVHTYKTDAEWTKDASGHWYEATCACVDAPLRKLQHTDKNKDAICDVCEFEYDHEHTYSEDWTADCTNHWYAADCGCIIEGTELAAHEDKTGDGECDACGYVIEDLHNHYYSADWTHDAEYHWHAALCEHGVEVADRAAHEINDAGYCTVCNAKIREIDKTNLQAILAAAVASNDKVVTGDVKLQEIVYDGSEQNGTLTLLDSGETGAFFVLGNGESYYFLKNFDGNGNLIGGEQQWYETLDNGNIFAIKMNVNSYDLELIDGDPAKLSGYTYLPGSILAAGYDDTNTLAQTLANFYDLMKNGENVSDATENYDAETGKYSFSFTYFTVNELTSGGEVYDIQLALYETEIEFTIDKNFVINLANFQVKVYNYYDEGKAENDLTYDKETNTMSKTASANPSYYIYTVHQTSGERTFTSPYPKESLIPIGFDFFYVTSHEFPQAFEWVIHSEELIGDTLTLQSGTYAYFHLGNPVPSITSFDFIDTSDFTFSFVNNDPDSTHNAWYMTPGSTDATINGYSSYINCLKLKMRDAGEYTVTIGFGDLVKTFTLIITAEPETEITYNDNQISVTLTDFHTYDNDEQAFVFTATEEGNYTFAVPGGLGARIDGQDTPKVDYYSTSGGSFTVGLNAGESVKIYFAASEYKTFYVDVTYAYADIPDPEIPEEPEEPTEINVIGTYTGSGITVVIDETKVTYTTSKYTSSYDYELIDGAVVIYNSYTGQPWASNMIAVNITAGKVTSVVYNGNSYTVEKEGGEEEEPSYDYNTTIVAGPNTLYFSSTEIDNDSAVRPVLITEAGKYSFSAGSLFIQSVTDAAGNVYPKNDDYTISLLPGEYYANFAMLSMFGVSADTPQTLNLENKGAIGGGSEDDGEDEEADELKASLHLFMPNNGTYDFMFVTVGDQYLVNIYDSTYDMYFTYELEDNDDGSYNMTVTYYERDGWTYDETFATTVEATVFVLYYDGVEWSMDGAGSGEVETDPVIEAVLGTYEIDGYTVMIYNTYSEDGYLANVYGEGYDLYFTFEVTDNFDGTYTIVLTYLSRPDSETGTEYVDEILALDIVIDTSSTGAVEGSSEKPYEITEPGDFYAFFPEGYTPIWFAYTVAQNGYVTISTEYANPWFQYGTNIDSVANNQGPDGIAQSVTIYALAGQTIYISVGDYDFVEAEIEFSVAFEAFESDSIENVVGTWTGAETNMWGGSVNYTFTINADGTGTGSCDMGYYVENYEITFVLVDGNTVTIYVVTTGEWGGAQAQFVFEYDSETKTLVGATFTLATEGSTVEPEQPEEPTPEEPTPEEPGETAGSGTSTDPYIITIPGEITFEGKHDAYIQFTATEAGTYVLTYPSGCYVTGMPGAAVKDSANCTYTFDMAAGETLKVNPWNNPSSGSFTYTIAKVEITTPDPEEPGEPGQGEATGAVTYVGNNGSRGMRVVIDVAADTMVITRAASGSLDNFEGGTTYTFSYSATLALANANGGTISGTVMDANGSTTAIMNLAFNADGEVVSLAWNGANYTNYVKQ